MTTRTCSAKHIPALWSSSAGLLACDLACLILWMAAPGGAQTRREVNASPSSANSSGLAGLARAYREAPTAVRRAALESYARDHSRDNTGSLARLALGIAAYEQKDYSAAIAA